MATKSSLSEQARNRENQRRLRKRRKDYTQEIERSLQTLKQQEVHATEVVQRAARLVVDENRLLRQLLNENGVPKEAIEDYLRKGRTDDPSSQQLQQVKQTISTVPGEGTSSNSSPIPVKAKDTSRSEGLSHQRLRFGLDTIVALSNGYAATEGTSNRVAPSPIQHIRIESVPSHTALVAVTPGVGSTDSSTPPIVVVESTRCNPPRHDTKIVGRDEMDCEEAALIITSLRGGSDSRDVWPELGCSHANRTRIKRSLLMDLAA